MKTFNFKRQLLTFNFALFTIFAPITFHFSPLTIFDSATFHFSLLTFNLTDAAVISKPSPNLGLVGYWSFNEGTSTVALDYSGNKNKGTLVNGPTWVDGKRGKALSFDGSDDYVTVPNSSILQFDTGTNITLSAWVRPSSLVSYGTILAKGRTAETQTANYVIRAGNDPGLEKRFAFYYRNSINDAWHIYQTNSDVFTINRWYHVAATYTFGTGSSIRLYIDGVLQAGTWVYGTGNVAPSVTTEPLWFGGVNYPGDSAVNELFPGLIDDVRIYNRALSAKEIQTLYNAGAAKFAPPNNLGLVGYWSMNEGTSTVALDYSGKKNKGTLVNGPTWVDGKLGKALNFDGGNDYVDVGSGESIDVPTLTVSAWIKRNVIGARHTIVADSIDSANDRDHFLWFLVWGDNTLLLVFGDGVIHGTVFSTKTITDTNWHHVAVYRNDATEKVQFFIDGIPDGEKSYLNTLGTLITLGTNNLRIGMSNVTDYLNPFNGLIDEVRIYNRALGANEIKTLYNSGAAKFAPPNNLGLVGYWSMNEGTSTVALDYSGKKNKGTLTNGPTWVDGKRGKALSFDGGDDYVDAGGSTSLEPTTALSVSAWIKRSANIPSSGGVVQSRKNTANERGWILVGSVGTTNNINFYIDPDAGLGGWIFARSNTALNANQFYHVVGTWDGSTVRIYVDGVLQTTTGVASSISYHGTIADNHAIGRYLNGTYSYFPGLIDDVRVYNRALSAQEVWALYNSR